MKKLTNHTAGARGINLKNGGTHWVEPGAEVGVTGKGEDKDPFFLQVGDDKFEVAGGLPDFGKASDAPAGEDSELVESVQAENAELKTQVATLTKERDDATAKVTKLEAENAELKKKSGS